MVTGWLSLVKPELSVTECGGHDAVHRDFELLNVGNRHPAKKWISPQNLNGNDGNGIKRSVGPAAVYIFRYQVYAVNSLAAESE